MPGGPHRYLVFVCGKPFLALSLRERRRSTDIAVRTDTISAGHFHFAFHKAAHVGHRQQVAEVLYGRVLGKVVEVRKRHALAQLGQANFGHFAVLDVLGIGEDVLGEQFSAGNLDVERLFQAEDDVEEVDRLGSQVADERGLGVTSSSSTPRRQPRRSGSFQRLLPSLA